MTNCLEEPTIIATIDPSRDDLQEIFTMLSSSTIPLNSNGSGRSKSFGTHRAMTLGYVVGRNTKRFDLSYYTKRH